MSGIKSMPDRAIGIAFALNSMAFASADVLLPEKSSEPALQPADIEDFVRNGYLHCAKAKLFLQALKREQPTLRIVFHDMART
jgi:hypothetical protein